MTADRAGPAGPFAAGPAVASPVVASPVPAFRWTAEHDEFRGAVRKLTETRVPLACAPSPASADPRERELWRAWTEEMGLPGLVIPEDHGGSGFSRLELAIAAEAGLLVVAAREPAGISLFVVEPGAGVEVTPLEVLDASRPMARVTLRDAAARRAGVAGQGWAAVQRALQAGTVFLAAEQVGGSRALLGAAVEHAKTRVQFGQPVGRFQGVKHRLADMAARTELAAAAAAWTAWQSPGSAAAGLGTAVAGAYCSEAYLETALDAIQVHGGMAITWEHHAHRFLRRARADAAVLLPPREHRRRLESMIGTGA